MLPIHILTLIIAVVVSLQSTSKSNAGFKSVEMLQSVNIVHMDLRSFISEDTHSYVNVFIHVGLTNCRTGCMV